VHGQHGVRGPACRASREHQPEDAGDPWVDEDRAGRVAGCWASWMPQVCWASWMPEQVPSTHVEKERRRSASWIGGAAGPERRRCSNCRKQGGDRWCGGRTCEGRTAARRRYRKCRFDGKQKIRLRNPDL
jgi:hypothetical protein